VINVLSSFIFWKIVYGFVFCYFFKCLQEFSDETLWLWRFLLEEFLNYKHNFLNWYREYSNDLIHSVFNLCFFKEHMFSEFFVDLLDVNRVCNDDSYFISGISNTCVSSSFVKLAWDLSILLIFSNKQFSFHLFSLFNHNNFLPSFLPSFFPSFLSSFLPFLSPSLPSFFFFLPLSFIFVSIV
jgi:hypothetical protein